MALQDLRRTWRDTLTKQDWVVKGKASMTDDPILMLALSSVGFHVCRAMIQSCYDNIEEVSEASRSDICGLARADNCDWS